jgi:hypothetical protein
VGQVVARRTRLVGYVQAGGYTLLYSAISERSGLVVRKKLRVSVLWTGLGLCAPDELRNFVSKNCGESGAEDGYALMSEAARLESQGDITGALATCEAVIERFPGTGVAKDAECGIRNLNDKMG